VKVLEEISAGDAIRPIRESQRTLPSDALWTVEARPLVKTVSVGTQTVDVSTQTEGPKSDKSPKYRQASPSHQVTPTYTEKQINSREYSRTWAVLSVLAGNISNPNRMSPVMSSIKRFTNVLTTQLAH